MPLPIFKRSMDMSRSKAIIAYLISLVVMIILFAVLSVSKMETEAFLVMFAWAIFVAVLSRYLRCPHCGRLPRIGHWFANYCSFCGESLYD